MPANRLILVDFDGTLFDIRKFANEMAAIFRSWGGIDFFRTFPRGKTGTYSLRDHLTIVSTKNRRKQVKKRLKRLFSRCPEFLFSDAPEFLSMLRQDPRNRTMLVTKGEMGYQSRKVFKALKKVCDLLDGIIIVEKSSKADTIKNLASDFDGAVIFLDDDPYELSGAKSVAPCIQTILIDRDHQFSNRTNADFLVRNLREALKIIRSGG